MIPFHELAMLRRFILRPQAPRGIFGCADSPRVERRGGAISTPLEESE